MTSSVLTVGCLVIQWFNPPQHQATHQPTAWAKGRALECPLKVVTSAPTLHI